MPILETIVHENSSGDGSFTDDIALIRLKREINFTNYVKPICLPFAENLRNYNFDGRDLQLVGFSRLRNGNCGSLT